MLIRCLKREKTYPKTASFASGSRFLTAIRNVRNCLFPFILLAKRRNQLTCCQKEATDRNKPVSTGNDGIRGARQEQDRTEPNSLEPCQSAVLHRTKSMPRVISFASERRRVPDGYDDRIRDGDFVGILGLLRNSSNFALAVLEAADKIGNGIPRRLVSNCR